MAFSTPSVSSRICDNAERTSRPKSLRQKLQKLQKLMAIHQKENPPRIQIEDDGFWMARGKKNGYTYTLPYRPRTRDGGGSPDADLMQARKLRPQSRQYHPDTQEISEPQVNVKGLSYDHEYLDEAAARSVIKSAMPELYPENDIALPEELYAHRSYLEFVLTTMPRNDHIAHVLDFWASLGGIAATINPVENIYIKTASYGYVPAKNVEGCPDLLRDLGEEPDLPTLKARTNGRVRNASAPSEAPSKKRRILRSFEMDIDSDGPEPEPLPQSRYAQYHLPGDPEEVVRKFHGGLLPEEIELAKFCELRGGDGFHAINESLRYSSVCDAH